MNLDHVVSLYVRLRDRKKEIEARHKEELEPLKKDMDTIEAALLKVFQETGQKSAKTTSGTAYVSEVESIRILDRDAVIDTVAEKGCWDVLNVSVAKKNLRESGIELPGIDISSVRKVNVRRS